MQYFSFFQSFSDHYNIKAINGGELPAILIFSAALKYLTDKLVKFISNTMYFHEDAVDADSIQWVLTVPAIWKQGARHFMRKAAYKVMYALVHGSMLWCICRNYMNLLLVANTMMS